MSLQMLGISQLDIKAIIQEILFLQIFTDINKFVCKLFYSLNNLKDKVNLDM